MTAGGWDMLSHQLSYFLLSHSCCNLEALVFSLNSPAAPIGRVQHPLQPTALFAQCLILLLQ